jgi:cytochrome c553
LQAAVALALLAGAAGAAFAQGGEPAKAQSIVEGTCAACHGADGNSPVPNFPKLAGLDAAYLLKQLQDFQAKRRPSEVMAPLVDGLSAEDLAGVAAFFAGQKAAPGTVREPGLLAAGKKMYDDGNPASGVPACAGCHGPEGAGSGRFPRLAGQHAEYATDQLKLFAAGKRKNDRRLMQAVADRMTEQEIRAVAEYLASQP